MLKIDLYDTFAIENLENTLRCKDVAGLKYKNIHPERKVNPEDIILLHMLKFTPQSDDIEKVEYQMEKKYDGEVKKMLVCDTDLNAISTFMLSQLYKEFDLLSIIRYSEIEHMYEELSKNKPVDLRENGIKSFFSSNKSVCFLFINYETRDRIFKHVIYNEKNKKNDDFLLSYSEKGYIPALKLTEKEIINYKKKFIEFADKKEFVYESEIWINKRSVYPEEINVEQIKNKVRIVSYSKESIIEMYKEDLETEGKADIDLLISIYRKSLKDRFAGADNRKREIKDLNPEETYDRITLGRNNVETIKKIFSFVNERQEIINEELKQSVNIENLVKELKGELKSGKHD